MLKRNNIQIIKDNFHYIEISKVNPESICQMAEIIGMPLKPDEITIKSTWKKYKKYFIYDKNQKPILFAKSVWEFGVLRELIAIHLSKYIFDKDLIPNNYVFGLNYKKGKNRDPEPIIMLTWVAGEPLSKKNWEKFAFQLGQLFYLHQILSLYDCDLRHFLADFDVVKRIDFGLSFYHMEHRYRGFEEYMPNGLPYTRDFWRGYRSESQKMDIILLNTREKLEQILKEIEKFKEDDLVNFDGKKFVQQLKNYWKREKLPILDEVSLDKEDIYGHCIDKAL
ncbi:MAG: hypothetical protein ACTSRZ_05035 [Promethearchaeota archaeon]